MIKGGRAKPIFTRDKHFPISDSMRAVDDHIKLWRAVLDQAFYDALLGDGMIYDEDLDEDIDAREWIEDETNPDFVTVCELADLDSDQVRRFYYLWKDKVNG